MAVDDLDEVTVIPSKDARYIQLTNTNSLRHFNYGVNNSSLNIKYNTERITVEGDTMSGEAMLAANLKHPHYGLLWATPAVSAANGHTAKRPPSLAFFKRCRAASVLFPLAREAHGSLAITRFKLTLRLKLTEI